MSNSLTLSRQNDGKCVDQQPTRYGWQSVLLLTPRAGFFFNLCALRERVGCARPQKRCGRRKKQQRPGTRNLLGQDLVSGERELLCKIQLCEVDRTSARDCAALCLS